MDIIKVQNLLEIRNSTYPFRNIRETYKTPQKVVLKIATKRICDLQKRTVSSFKFLDGKKEMLKNVLKANGNQYFY